MTGDALETSMEIEFTVDVLQGKFLSGPWAENDEYVMFFGIGGSLQEALQRATTGLAQWIEGDYKLNSAEVAVVLGSSIRYDVSRGVLGRKRRKAPAHLYGVYFKVGRTQRRWKRQTGDEENYATTGSNSVCINTTRPCELRPKIFFSGGFTNDS